MKTSVPMEPRIDLSADPSAAAAMPETRARRPYTPPAVIYREPLEAIAATCAPTPPAKANPGTCPSGPISS